MALIFARAQQQSKLDELDASLARSKEEVQQVLAREAELKGTLDGKTARLTVLAAKDGEMAELREQVGAFESVLLPVQARLESELREKAEFKKKVREQLAGFEAVLVPVERTLLAAQSNCDLRS